jgi:hypothetical protein
MMSARCDPPSADGSLLAVSLLERRAVIRSTRLPCAGCGICGAGRREEPVGANRTRKPRGSDE